MEKKTETTITLTLTPDEVEHLGYALEAIVANASDMNDLDAGDAEARAAFDAMEDLYNTL